MVEPPPSTGLIPIPRAIAPPRIEFFLRRHKVAKRIDPWPRLAHQIELFDLDRRVTDDTKQGLVIPDIGFERRDIR